MQISLLSDEIKFLDSHLRHYDELSFKIKGWSITIWSGIIAFSAKEGLWLIGFASIPISIAFWILDAAQHQWRRPLLHAFRHVRHVRIAGECAQMRGTAPAQIPGARISVCHGVGGMFAASGTIIMSNEPP
jgi:hypothetical protein